MVILRNQNKITDLFMILALASPFNQLMKYDRGLLNSWHQIILKQQMKYLCPF